MKFLGLRPAAAVLVICAAALAAFSWPAHKRVETRAFNVSATPLVDVSNSSGDIHVTGWDRNTVQLTTTKTAADENDLNNLTVGAIATSAGVTVRAQYPADCSNCDITFELYVPRAARVTTQTASGDVSVESVGGPVRLQTASGGATLRNDAGAVRLHASSGDVSLRGCTGAVEAVTSSGDIDLRGAAGDADVVTSSGTVHLDYARFDAVRTVRAESSSGDIDLVLPRGAGLRLEASTSSGSIDTNLRLPIRERDSGADVAAQIGSGHAFAQLSTSSGDVSVTMR